MAQAIKCSHCGAPLPGIDARTIRCHFCGTENRIGPNVGQTQVREAVRQILQERVQPARPPQPVNKAMPFIIGGVVIAMSVMGLVTSLIFAAPAPKHTPRPVVVTPRPVPPPKPPEPPPPPPKKPWGKLVALVADERGDLLAALGTTLVKLDPKTLDVKWTSSFGGGSFGYAIVIPRGAAIAVMTGDEISFIDSQSGEKTDYFRYKNGGILERACAAGPTQVLVDVLGNGVMRFDAATGKKANWGPSCALKDKLACPSSQRCGWDRFQNADYSCRYSVHDGKDAFRSCTTEDGKKRTVLVSTGTKKWEVETNESVEAYFGVVGDLLVMGGYHALVVFDKNTGEEKWRKAANASTAFVSGDTLFFGADETVVALDVNTGDELRRLPLRD